MAVGSLLHAESSLQRVRVRCPRAGMVLVDWLGAGVSMYR